MKGRKHMGYSEKNFLLNIKNIPYYLLGLFFGFSNMYVSGPLYLGEMLLMIYCSFQLIKYRKLFIINKRVLKLLLGLVAFTIYISVVGLFINNPYTLINFMKYSIIIVQIILYSSMLARNEHGLKIILFLYIVASYFVSFVFNITALDIAMKLFPFGVILTLFLAYFSKLDFKSLLVSIALVGIYSIISVSRTSLVLTLTLSLFLLFLILFDKKMKHNKSLIILFSFVALIGLFSYSFKFLEQSLQADSISNSERIYLIEVAIEQIKLKPFIGVGIGNYNNYAQTVLGYQFRAGNMTPHNLFLEILAETGIIGLILFSSVFLKYIVLANQDKNRKVQLLIIIFVSYFMFNTFSGLSRNVFAIYVATIIFLITRRRNHNELYMQLEKK